MRNNNRLPGTEVGKMGSETLIFSAATNGMGFRAYPTPSGQFSWVEAD